MSALQRPRHAHRRALAERLRQERWRDVWAAISLLGVALLVLGGLPPR